MASKVRVEVGFTGTDDVTPILDRIGRQSQEFGNKIEAGAARANVSMRNVGSAVSTVAGQFTNLSGVAGLASNAILGLATATGPVSIAFAALTATVGLLVYRIEQARDRLRELAEIELAALAREMKALDMENTIKRQLAVLRAAIPEIEAVKQKYDEMRIAAEKAGARPQALAAIDEARAREIANIQRKIAEERAKQLEQEQKALEAQQKAIDSARDTLVGQIETQRAQTIALQLGEAAAIDYRIAILSGSEAVKKLGDEGIELIRILRDEQQAFRQVKEEAERHNKILEETAKQADLESRVMKVVEEDRRVLNGVASHAIDVAG